MQLADLFELDAEAMPQRAFRAKFVKQCFGLVEGVGRHILGLEQVPEAALNLGFGKQGEILLADGRMSAFVRRTKRGDEFTPPNQP
jgi:hypothetical protein